MAVTVTDDLTTLDLADSNANWNTTTPMSSEAVDPDSKVEGTACIEARISSGGGVGLLNNNHGSVDLTDAHIYAWMRQSMIWALFVNGGVRFRIATSTLGTTAYGQWNTLGQDKGVASFKGWVSGVIDPLKPFQSVNGTPPAITAVVSTGFEINWLTGNGKALAIVDYVKYGGKIFVKGGGVATEGTFADISAADETAGRGLLKLVGGVSFVNCGVDFGDTATLTTRFIDGLTTVVFEDFQVAGGFYKIRHLGNATGTNLVTFGAGSGTGVDKEGSAGINISSAGAAPFWIEAIDADVDNAQYFGCNLAGPSAIYDDQLRNFKQEDNSGASFVDLTREANDTTANDAQPFPTGAGADDAAYFGANERFYSITVNTGTAGTGTYTVTLEYWDGSAWAPLTDLTDGTSGFKTAGSQVITYAIPDDWATTTIDTDLRYWIRSRRDGGTITINPDITQVTIQMAGDIRWEDPAAEMVGCVLTNMGNVRVRNGAFLKKTTLSGSLSLAKHAALDLGSTDPAADTVRDLTIQNGSKGVLLKDYTRFFDAGAAVDKGAGKVGIPATAHGFPTGQEILIAGTTNYNGVQTVDATSSANEIVITDTFIAETFAITDSAVPNTTFNIRAFSFSSNTNDFRVDFPATSTVVINLLESTTSDTALTPANQDNVNASTLSLIAAVTLTVTVTDSAGAAVEGVRARIENASTGALITQGETNASGIYSASYNYSGDLAVRTKARLKGFKPFRTLGTIISTGISVGATLQSDTIVDLP